MKLRVQDNSIRLRLKQEEVNTLAQDGAIESRMAFGPDAETQHLVYRLEAADVTDINVVYRAHCVTVQLPNAQAKDWRDCSDVGFECDVPLEGGGSMYVLIEKDFKCLEKRVDENDCYPNPNISC